MLRSGWVLAWAISLLSFSNCVWAQGSPALEARFFSGELYPLLEKAACRGCHAEDGVASTTRLRFPPESASTKVIEDFGWSLAVLVNASHPEASLLLQKPTLRVEHTGGKLITPGSKEETTLIGWINFLAASRGDVPENLQEVGPVLKLDAPTSMLMRRLTHSQYNNTVSDLLGDLTLPANQFPQEDFVNGFKNQINAQSIPPLLSEAYSAAAEKLAENAYRRGFFKSLLDCRAASPSDKACIAGFIRSFGLKAFRRPLTKVECNRYSALFEQEARRGGDWARGGQIVVEAMLQAPNFLFRAEHRTKGSWRNYEIANRLSYFLWDTMPDDSLFQRAGAGRLSTPGEIERVARSMMSDPRAHQALNEFISQWLRFDRLLGTTRDRRAFPEFNAELAAAMAEEARRLVAHLVWDDRNFMELFTADYSFINSDLASLYRLPKPEEEFGRVSFPASSTRSGILGQAAFLTLTSKPLETSPTARGVFVREQFLCQKVPNPPPGTSMNLQVPSKSSPLGVRARLGQHQSNPSCARCHSLIDSIGYGFEKFDAVGKEREKETIRLVTSYQERAAKPESVELAIDSSGIVKGIPNSEFASPKELGRLLAATQACQDCVAKQFFRYAFGRLETQADRPALEKVQNAFRNSGFRFRELMIALVISKAFLEE